MPAETGRKRQEPVSAAPQLAATRRTLDTVTPEPAHALLFPYLWIRDRITQKYAARMLEDARAADAQE